MVDFTGISNRQFIHGDFDLDGTPNIDDAKPFDGKTKKRTSEISLSKELKAYKKATLEYVKLTKELNRKFKQKGFSTKYRIKSVNSIINKLRRKRLSTIKDIGGLMILTKSPEDSYDVGRYIERQFKVVEFDDYYKNPLSKYYRALHYVVQIGKNFIEIQVKTKKESKIHLAAHTKYKEGKLSEKYKEKLKQMAFRD